MNRLFLMIIFTLCLIGCSFNQTSKINYYVLEPAKPHHQHSTPASTDAYAKRIILKAVTVAPYLTRSQLPMQLDNHQVYYADAHLWAEPLTDGLKRSLVTSFITQGDIHIFTEMNAVSGDNAIFLVVHFDDFVANQLSGVIANGTYSVYSGVVNRDAVIRRFSLHRELEADGFDSAVSQLRFLINDLAELIYEDVKEQYR